MTATLFDFVEPEIPTRSVRVLVPRRDPRPTPEPIPMWHPPMRRTLDMDFEDFHAANPHVYDLLCELSRDLLRAGGTPTIKGVYEVARHRLSVESNTDYKLNNNYTALYARRIMANEPDLDGVFRLRERHGCAA